MEELSIEAAFLFGAAGAAAPEILRLYELRTRPDEFKWSPTYLILTIPFLLLGGLVAVILPATTVWGAFYTGISLPVIISAAAKKAIGDVKPDVEISLPSSPAEGRPTTTQGRSSRREGKPLSGLRAYVSALL